MAKINKKTKNLILIFISFLIIILAVFLRVWQLSQIPPGVWYDEAYNALDAISALNSNHFQIFYPENFGREGLFINLLAISFKIFGFNNVALRLVPAIIGALTIVGFYFLLRQLRLHRTSIVLAIFALSTSFYHLNFSRIAFRAIMVPLFLVWSLYFFLAGYRQSKDPEKKIKSFFYFFLAGLLTGLGLHTYIAYRVVPLIFINIFFGLFLIQKSLLKKYWLHFLIFLFGAILSAGPLLLYFAQHPDSFSGRSNAVSIFHPQNNLTPLQAFGKSLFLHLQSIFFVGDGNQRHNYNSFPLLPAVWGLFFFLGFLISLKEIFLGIVNHFRQRPLPRLFLASLVAQSIFWIMLIPGVLSLEGIPHFLRIIGVTPAIFIMLILPFEYLRRLYLHLKHSPLYPLKLWRWRVMQTAFLVLVTIFFITGFFQSYLYFKFWGQSPRTAEAFQNTQFQFGQIIKTLPLKKQNYLLLNNEISFQKNNPLSISEKSLVFSAYPQIKNYRPFHLNDMDTVLEDRSLDCSRAQFILQPYNPLLSLKKIKNYCRNFKLEQIQYKKNGTQIPAVKVWVLR